MSFSMKIVFLCIFCYYVVSTFSAVKYESKPYFAVERPKILSLNNKHITFANISSRRYSRRDPIYYFNLRFVNVYPIGNNYTIHIYFYEFLTNVYKPSFVELHVRVCVLLHKEPVFGAAMMRALRQIKSDMGCPVPPGDWDMQNCTMNAKAMPNFPFPKGRIYANMTYNPTAEFVAGGYVDFQIKEMKIKLADKS